jgi:hypothetical protein
MGLPLHEQLFLLRVVSLHYEIRLGLWFLPYAYLCRLLQIEPGGVVQGSGSNGAAPERITRALRATSGLVPCATCLTKALAALVLLRKADCPAQLRIGVTHTTDGKFGAHAWVESNGRIIIGKVPNLRSYTVLSPLESASLR